MKQHSRAILQCAIVYTAAVAIVDFFLAKIPVVSWLALGIVFVFFTGFIVDSVIDLLEKRKLVPMSPPVVLHDELDSLEKIVEGALVDAESDSLRILEAKLKALATVVGLNNQLPRPNVDPKSSRNEADTKPRSQSLKEIESLLAKVEAWLN